MFKLNEHTSYGKTNTSLARQLMFTAIVLSGVFGRETYLHRPREVCYNYLPGLEKSRLKLNLCQPVAFINLSRFKPAFINKAG